MNLNVKSVSIQDGFWKAWGMPPPVTEYRFDKTRLWRIDYAWSDIKLAVETEGGIWTRGRHTRGGGFKKDMEKYNQLSIQGWTLLRYEYGKINFDEVKCAHIRLQYPCCPRCNDTHKVGKFWVCERCGERW